MITLNPRFSLFPIVLTLYLSTSILPKIAAANSLSLVGAIPYELTHISEPFGNNTLTYGGGLGFGGGVLLSHGIMDSWQIDTGGIFLQRSYQVSGTLMDTTVSDKSNTRILYLPVSIAYRMERFFKLLLGGYYALPIGSDVLNDYGARTGAELALGDSFFIELNYNYGFRDLGGSFKTRELLGIIGYRILGGVSK